MLGRKSQEPKVLEVDANFQGNLSFKDAVNLHISGHFEGKLETKGELTIGEKAVVKADILGERILIAGHVTGDVTASSEIRISATAKLLGNIQTPSLVIEKCGVFHGLCIMLKLADKDDSHRRVFLTPDEVARYLSVEQSLIAEWAENGKLPGYRDGAGWKFDKEKVDEWIANGRIS